MSGANALKRTRGSSDPDKSPEAKRHKHTDVVPDADRKEAQRPAECVRTGKKFYALGIADPGTGEADGFFFTHAELADIVDKSLILKKQVWLEHGDGSPEVIGRVRYAWVDKKKGLIVMMEFDYSTLMSNVVLEWMRSGLFSGISLGYKSDVQKVDGMVVVTKKTINEVSIVRDPYHKSCRIFFVGTKLPSSLKQAVVVNKAVSRASDIFPYF